MPPADDQVDSCYECEQWLTQTTGVADDHDSTEEFLAYSCASFLKNHFKTHNFGAYDKWVPTACALLLLKASGKTNPDNRSEDNVMRKIENVLDKRISVRSLGSFLGGSLLVAIVAGVFRHRRAIKRLIEIQRM